MLNRRRTMTSVLCISLMATVANAALENQYTFDTDETLTVDSSGNERDAFIDDLELRWVEDDERGGVLELGGSTNGFLLAEVPELPGDGFTIMLWAYRDPLLAGGAGGANDGLFQLSLATDDLDFLPTPPIQGREKIVGAWVQKTDAAVWGRINDEVETVNLGQEYFMEDEVWTHFTYRGNGQEFELVVNGDSGEGSVVAYDGTLLEHDAIYIGRQGNETWGGRLDDFRVYSEFLSDEQIQAIIDDEGGGPVVVGDFNSNEQLDAGDMDLLTEAVSAGTNDVDFDLDNDQIVNDEDRRVWIEDLANSYFGDSNLDREFNSADFVAVFAAGKYESGQPALWSEGDWDGDGVFNSGDFVKAFGGGGYESGPRPVTAAVPEPNGLLSLLGLSIALLVHRRRQ